MVNTSASFKKNRTSILAHHHHLFGWRLKPFVTYSHQETISCYFPLGTMLWVLCILQFMLHMAGGCAIEERIALMRIRSSLVEANSEQVLASWGRSDDCCSWERVRCNNSTRVSGLNLDSVYVYQTCVRDPCWNLNLTIFSSFHELQQLDLFSNSACLQNFDGTYVDPWT